MNADLFKFILPPSSFILRFMDSKRWQQIEDIFQAALDRPVDEREKYIREECGDDDELLAEVKKFIALLECRM